MEGVLDENASPPQFYSNDAIPGEMETLPGFIIDRRSLKNIQYIDESVLISDSTRKLQDVLDRK